MHQVYHYFPTKVDISLGSKAQNGLEFEQWQKRHWFELHSQKKLFSLIICPQNKKDLWSSETLCDIPYPVGYKAAPVPFWSPIDWDISRHLTILFRISPKPATFPGAVEPQNYVRSAQSWSLGWRAFKPSVLRHWVMHSRHWAIDQGLSHHLPFLGCLRSVDLSNLFTCRPLKFCCS